MSKFLSCNITIVVVTGRVFFIYLTPILTFYFGKVKAFCVSWISYDHLCYVPWFTCLAIFVERYQRCVTTLHDPKCTNCQKAIVVIISEKVHCFMIIYYVTSALIWALCVLWTTITTYITLLGMLHWYQKTGNFAVLVYYATAN